MKEDGFYLLERSSQMRIYLGPLSEADCKTELLKLATDPYSSPEHLEIFACKIENGVADLVRKEDGNVLSAKSLLL